MQPLTRLGAYGAGLLVLFAGSFAAASALVPESFVQQWNERPANADHAGHEDAGNVVTGVALEQDGYRISPVTAATTSGRTSALQFSIIGPDESPLTDYTRSHDKELHLVVVRSDGAHFRHEHPQMTSDGTWSIDWRWPAGGTYRVFADFVPEAGASEVTVSRTVIVDGDAGGVRSAALNSTTAVDGYNVRLDGTLRTDRVSDLRATISRDGVPVSDLQPYLGALGHLVVLREGDLAYLHAHPEGAEPVAGKPSGPVVTFSAQAPTAGRFLLYLDFKVDGVVRTAEFVLQAPGGGRSPSPAPAEASLATTDDHDH